MSLRAAVWKQPGKSCGNRSLQAPSPPPLPNLFALFPFYLPLSYWDGVVNKSWSWVLLPLTSSRALGYLCWYLVLAFNIPVLLRPPVLCDAPCDPARGICKFSLLKGLKDIYPDGLLNMVKPIAQWDFHYCGWVWQKLSFSWQYSFNTWWALTGVTCKVRRESSGVWKLKKLGSSPLLLHTTHSQ